VVLFTAPVDYCPAMISEVRFAVGNLPRRALAIIQCTVRSAAVASGVAASHLRYALVLRGLLLPRQAASIILSSVRSAAVASVAWTPSGHDRNGNLPPCSSASGAKRTRPHSKNARQTLRLELEVSPEKHCFSCHAK